MVRYLVTLALFLSLVACGGREADVSSSTADTNAQASPAAAAAAPDPVPAPAQQAAATPATTSAAAPAVPAGQVIASETYTRDQNVRADVTEIRRVSGGALLVKWRVTNTSPTETAHYDFSWDDLYYVDPAENKKYEYLKDSDGNRILDIYYGNLKPGETRSSWAKFPAPPATSTKISLMLPKFPPLEDVPVTP
jgi:hypothetical protein